MRKDKVRRYPVLDKRGKLVGIVTDSDLLNASPSDATTLSVWEISYLLSKITVERVMEKEVITTTEDTTIEEAAGIMAEKKIGGLPVVRGDRLLGIITETDLFRVFLESMGARVPGIRVTIEALDVPGGLARLTTAICDVGGNIKGLGIIQGESSDLMQVTFKVVGVSLEDLRKALLPIVESLVDIREERGIA
jgi:acetoin utilization protein AcuB